MTDCRQRVSVLIPAYNRCELLKETIETVLRQTSSVHEVIVIDDGSTDGTAAMIRGLAPKVRCLSQENAGVAAAFNNGMAQATGDWIAFLGSDDLWAPNKIERQLQYLSQYPSCDLVHTGYAEFGHRTRVMPPRPRFLRGEYRVDHFLFGEDWICPSSALVRASLQVRFRDWASASEDIIYHADLLRAGAVFGYINEPLVQYRVHLGSMNFEKGGQSRAASRQLRWIAEAFADQPSERDRLAMLFYRKVLDRIQETKRWRRWPEYWEWRQWLAENWPDSLPRPKSLSEHIYPPITYRFADLPGKALRRLAR